MLDHTTADHADARAPAPDPVNDRTPDLLFREARLPTASSLGPYGSPSSNAPTTSPAWGQPA